MRTARTLLLAAFAAITALALTASTATAGHLGNEEAHAGETLEVIDEATGVHCPAVELDANGHDVVSVDGSDICRVNAHGVELELSGHAFGIEDVVSICDVEFSGAADQHGEGWIDHAEHFDPPEPHPVDSCERDPCEEGANEMEPWPVHADEENGQAFIQAEFCLVPQDNHGGTKERCLVDIPFDEVSPHHYETGAFHTPGHNHGNATNCELESGTGIAIEGTPVELIHP